MIHQNRIPPGIIPKTWLGRVSATLVAAALAVVGLFFLAFALVAAALIAGIVIVRIWWALRKLRAQREADVIEGSYSVETDATPAVISADIDPAVLPTDRK
jgi:predicted lipid-binding transport protein (Tim44 family)